MKISFLDLNQCLRRLQIRTPNGDIAVRRGTMAVWSSASFLRSGAPLLGIAVALALTVGVPGDSRSQSTEPVLPPLPPGVEQPAEYAFGDAVMRRDLRAWGPVFDALALRFGKAKLRLIHFTLAADADVEALRRHFDREMIDGRGWRSARRKTLSGDAWSHGYESPDGRHVLMLVGLKPRPGETFVPLNLLTTLRGG